MTKTDARKILDISSRAGLKSAERAYRQKLQILQLCIRPGNPRSERQQAEVELVELTDAWKTMQTKQPTRKRCAKPRATVNRQKPVKQSATIWDVIYEMGQSWNILVSMVPLPKPATVAILIVYFLLVMVTLFLHLMEGA